LSQGGGLGGNGGSVARNNDNEQVFHAPMHERIKHSYRPHMTPFSLSRGAEDRSFPPFLACRLSSCEALRPHLTARRAEVCPRCTLALLYEHTSSIHLSLPHAFMLRHTLDSHESGNAASGQRRGRARRDKRTAIATDSMSCKRERESANMEGGGVDDACGDRQRT